MIESGHPRPSATSETIAIRGGGHDDLDGVIGVMDAAFDSRFGERWTRSQCAGILPMSGVDLRLAHDASAHIIGFTLARVVGDEAELLLLAVDPAFQKRGVGRMLLADFVARANHRGAHQLHLEVRDGNPALALYDSAGFAVAGRRPGYYHGPGGQLHDALTLRLDSDC
jgi:ribosomal-protein-alanine N-acetyltransferase